MATLILSVFVIGLAILGLAMGSLLGRGPAQGSCGGLSCLKDVACVGCPRHGARRDTRRNKVETNR